jgi:hypothetical protein
LGILTQQNRKDRHRGAIKISKPKTTNVAMIVNQLEE